YGPADGRAPSVDRRIFGPRGRAGAKIGRSPDGTRRTRLLASACSRAAAGTSPAARGRRLERWPLRLQGEGAGISRAASGIGAAAAERFAAAGAAVLLADLDGSGAEAVAAGIRGDGGRAEAVQADVTDEADSEAMVGAAVDRFGDLDVVFNNAGIVHVGG